MSSELAQVKFEHALATACYRLGEVLADQQKSVADIQVARDEHFKQLEALISQDKWRLLQENFDLPKQSICLLAIVYLFQLEPDLLSVYLKLSWYEQGGAVSAKRAFYLAMDDYHEDAASDYPLLVLSSSKLVESQLLICSYPATPLMQSLTVSEPLFEYLTSNSGVNQLSRSRHIDGYLHRIIDAASPATAVIYEDEFAIPSALLNTVEIEHQEEALAFIHNLILELKQKNLQIGDFWLVTAPTLSAETSIQLHHAILRAQLENLPAIQAIFWPSLISDSVASPDLRQLAEYLIKTPHILVFCNPNYSYEDEHNALWVREWLARSCYQYKPVVTRDKRVAGWQELCVSEECADALTKAEAEQLVDRYPIASFQMVAAFQDALRKDSSKVSFQSLQQACLKNLDSKIKDLACFSLPRVTLADMVLRKEVVDQLNEIMARMTYRQEMEAEFSTFHGGIQALFWGPSGTGKTMAAEAIAGELGLPHYKVNLANVTSKWIGETEKHLSKIFDQAEQQQAVLLFDEADAIFAKRSQVESSHDKNANLGVSYLLQRMENYHGILLLSTNFKANIDDAFLRRFTTVTEFTLPDKNTRKTLWQRAWKGALTLDPSIDLNSLAESFELSPSQIRNVAERACLFALMDSRKVIDKIMLASSLRREFEKQSAGFLTSKRLSDWLQ